MTSRSYFSSKENKRTLGDPCFSIDLIALSLRATSMSGPETFDSSQPLASSDDSEIVNVRQINAIFRPKLFPNFFSYERALYFFEKGGPNHALGGLINIGCNCYVNVVIQCLAYTPGFPQFCNSLPNVMYQQNSDSAFFLDSFAHIFSEMESNKTLTPTWLLTDAHYIGDTFKQPIQQDAHEYLLAVLQIFQNECVRSVMPPATPDQQADKSEQNDTKIKVGNFKEAFEAKSGVNLSESIKPAVFDTMIDHFFVGNITVQMKCHSCDCEIHRRTKFYDLTIPIREYSDLQTALSSITATSEHVITDECENCKKTSRITKTTSHTKYPLILIVTLLRFDNLCKKIEDFFEFQQTITVEEIQYELYAMILHDGRLISHGHFVAFVMDQNNVWYKADDRCIYKIKEDQQVYTSCPYVLFYKQIVE